MSAHYHHVCEHGMVHAPVCSCTDKSELLVRITCPPENAPVHQAAAAQLAGVQAATELLKKSPTPPAKTKKNP